MKTPLTIAAGLLVALTLLLLISPCNGCARYETREWSEYHDPKSRKRFELVDDKLEDKQPRWDPALVDRRPVGDWSINKSAAVISLDVPMIKPDQERDLLALHPSYAAAIAATRKSRGDSVVILPSVNLIDGKAKQFDDGLYAAIDLDRYQREAVPLVARLARKLDGKGPAAPFLAAALQQAGIKAAATDRAALRSWLARFDRQQHVSRPSGFYTWTLDLRRCYRFMRFLQQQFSADLSVPKAILAALQGDAALMKQYRAVVGFYDRLTNPHRTLSLADLADGKPVGAHGVAVLPPSTSRENELFDKLFPRGIPAGANLMQALIQRIRSGEVSLAPRPDSGWYDYQVYALETLLLPERAPENQKLMLSKAYKQRMLEAFKALLVKRRETHLRQMGVGSKAAAPLEKGQVKPRLRVEPCPSYFQRTARAYAFVGNLLAATLGKRLAGMHGLRKGGRRALPLDQELTFMRRLYYGLYLISCEDIGLRPSFLAGETVDRERCYALASGWLGKAFTDPDMAIDTRVSVPILVDPARGVTRLWATVGVRMARLKARFARLPKVKPKTGQGEWKEPESWQVGPATYLIPVDAFVEAELQGLVCLTRDELRAVCDRHETRDQIAKALAAYRP